MNKALIVEDDIELRTILAKIVSDTLNFEVKVASGGHEAIKILTQDKEREFNLILCDYAMPDGHGGIVYDFVRNFSKMPFILITAYHPEDCPELRNFNVDNPNDEFIQKPLSPGNLIDIVKKHF